MHYFSTGTALININCLSNFLACTGICGHNYAVSCRQETKVFFIKFITVSMSFISFHTLIDGIDKYKDAISTTWIFFNCQKHTRGTI